MNRRELIERLAAEIAKAGADGNGARARRLAALQWQVIARMWRDTAADPPGDPAAVPLPRPVPRRERIEW